MTSAEEFDRHARDYVLRCVAAVAEQFLPVLVNASWLDPVLITVSSPNEAYPHERRVVCEGIRLQGAAGTLLGEIELQGFLFTNDQDRHDPANIYSMTLEIDLWDQQIYSRKFSIHTNTADNKPLVREVDSIYPWRLASRKI